jgi:hypothetical protein
VRAALDACRLSVINPEARRVSAFVQADDKSQRAAASRIGFWVAASTVFLSVVSLGVSITTLPRSGPFCDFDTCVTFPYTNIAEFFPRDYLWMFPATLLLFSFLVLMSCVHSYATEAAKPFTLSALAFAAISAALLSVDYFIQLTVIQPSVLRGETDGLSLWSQYNPHGLFIALEALGYLLMSAALLFASAAFGRPTRLERSLRWLLVAPFVLTVSTFGALVAIYGHDLEYRFEVAVIAIDYTALIAVGTLLGILFKGAPRPGD